ncbi:MAG: hypothetical protein WBA53_03655, partial [Burkholderiaceae bacterium]
RGQKPNTIRKSPMRLRNQSPAFAVGIVAALALGAAQAEQQQPRIQEVPTSAPTAVAGDAQAVRVVRDKETGKLRAPTADELESMESQERAARKARGLPEVADPKSLKITRHANGMRSAKLGPEFLMTLRGERQSDGAVRRFHPDGTEHDPVARALRPTE